MHIRPEIPHWVVWVVMAAFAAACIYCAVIDLRERIIPNRITYPMGIISIVLAPVLWSNWTTHLICGFGVGLFFFLLANFKVRGQYAMGMGDVKLYTVAGFALGLGALPCVLISTLVGSIEGIVILVKKGTSTQIAHGHHICIGILIMLALGIQGVIA